MLWRTLSRKGSLSLSQTNSLHSSTRNVSDMMCRSTPSTFCEAHRGYFKFFHNHATRSSGRSTALQRLKERREGSMDFTSHQVCRSGKATAGTNSDVYCFTTWTMFVQLWCPYPSRERRDKVRDLLGPGHRCQREINEMSARSWTSQTPKRTSTLLPTRENKLCTRSASATAKLVPQCCPARKNAIKLVLSCPDNRLDRDLRTPYVHQRNAH